MEPCLIVPLTKSPHATGRYGPRAWQDWYRGLLKARNILSASPDSCILVISAVHITGEKSEEELYVKALEELGVKRGKLVVIRKAQETIEQIRIAVDMGRSLGLQPVFISTWLHYPRVRWLCRGMQARHVVAWGIPRPREAITDVVLAFLFPVIDLAGKREWFLNRVTKRRMMGKH
ncbi:MAG TPA: ElyC/SanA/YdcF family protein [Candidatus Paceibacterota bacterium]|nr:ElyC/SanA/YdcF family protein [Candidatus Paceibacterota bacterium]